MIAKVIWNCRLNKRSLLIVFAHDVEVSSPSAAATLVHGGSANGLIAWKKPRGSNAQGDGGWFSVIGLPKIRPTTPRGPFTICPPATAGE